MTTTTTEIEAIEHLDFGSETKCESHGIDCPNSAKWLFIAPNDTCPITAICDSCKNATIDWINKYNTTVIYCLRCGVFQPVADIRWERL